ncbi:hypothetical protein NHH03_26465 [Stieleria sp. TO1_6]|uniref:hypothetical protein n=1 Tax=Stieleria tagensis TaxID=2956795 RepID=UPI00209AF1B1|nr:hypothetical protein [Stieleria tagensis]MCO8125310.1 hypothetical protein [Stieleria tagensis]
MNHLSVSPDNPDRMPPQRADSGGNASAGTPSATGTRREAMARIAQAAIATPLLVGCSRSQPSAGDSSEKPATTTRRDVPLRIALAGTAADADSIRSGWSMASQQPLKIELIEIQPDTYSAAGDADLAERLSAADVVIYPQYLLGQLERSRSSVSFHDDTLQDYQDRYGKPLPAVMNGLGAYGGATWGVAIGAKLFALLSLDPEAQCQTWVEYHDWVERLDGKAAEPTAPGWAATSFLNRCASSVDHGWLFDRNTLAPQWSDPDFAAVLKQFADTVGLYQQPSLTPQSIWQGLRRGDLQGGIGYEVADDVNATDNDDASDDSQEVFDVSVSDCPQETDVDRLCFSPWTPLASISSGCRQTDASRDFIGWLCGGERMEMVRGQTALYSPTRTPAASDFGAAAGGTAERSATPYVRWLSNRLQTRQVATPLLLPAASRYYQSLDQHVIACLSGDATATDALAAVNADWQTISDQVGREQQIVAWRKTLGFGS